MLYQNGWDVYLGSKKLTSLVNPSATLPLPLASDKRTDLARKWKQDEGACREVSSGYARVGASVGRQLILWWDAKFCSDSVFHFSIP